MCRVIADAAWAMAALELRIVNDIPLMLVPISCTTMRDGGGVASVAAAPVGQFWWAERAPTASPPLSVTVLMGGGIAGGGGMALLSCAESMV